MINLQGVSISLTAGPGKAEFECFEPPYTQRGAEVIRAELDAPICPHINIDAGFDWHGADFLCVKACYGTDVPMKSCRIAKPAEGLGVEMDLNTWKVWDEKRFEWREASFKFCDLEYTREPSERWSESRRLSIGTIFISVQRMNQGDNTCKYMWPEMKFEPIMKVGFNVSVPGGIDHAICIAKSTKVDKSRLYDMGSETRLEGLIGNWFNFRFNYRSESYLQDQSIEPLNPAGYLTDDTQIPGAAQESVRTSIEQEALGRGRRQKFRRSIDDELGGTTVRSVSYTRNPYTRNPHTKRVAPIQKFKNKRQNFDPPPVVTSGRKMPNATATNNNFHDRNSSIELGDVCFATPVASSSSISHGRQPPLFPEFITIPATRAERITKLKEEEDAVDEMILQQLLAKKAKLKHEREQLEALQTSGSSSIL